MTRACARLIAAATILFTRLITAFQACWAGCAPRPVQRIYYANHASHCDSLLIWAALPPALRRKTRPVAGADYWLKSRLRRFFATKVFRSVLIDREHLRVGGGPIKTMAEALDEGASLILFPEGTRNLTETLLLPFKTGLHHLARKRPEIELVPVWLANLNRVLPKGELLPVPLLCQVTFGVPLRLHPEETRADFLTRAHEALLSLAPTHAVDERAVA